VIDHVSDGRCFKGLVALACFMALLSVGILFSVLVLVLVLVLALTLNISPLLVMGWLYTNLVVLVLVAFWKTISCITTVPLIEFAAFCQADPVAISAVEMGFHPFCTMRGQMPMNIWAVITPSSCSRMMRPGLLGPDDDTGVNTNYERQQKERLAGDKSLHARIDLVNSGHPGTGG
jgi:hypothetical protein